MVALQLIAGLVLLVAGAELLVKGASKIAAAASISPLVIGLTVVALGTSSPELAVSVQASLNGQTDIALGNVVGSNIFNVLFILGLSSVIVPLVVAQQLIRLDVPIMIGSTLLLLAFAWDRTIAGWEGAVLLALGIAYTVFIIRQSRKEKNSKVLEEYQEEFGEKAKQQNTPLSLLFVVVGLGMLVLGSRWLVNSATAIAAALGISDLIISLTIVAAGTSLPEVATSVIASIRGERDIAVGNAVGSNIFNILFILGISAMTAEGQLEINEQMIGFDLPVMVAVAAACLPIFFTGRKLDRWEGFIFLGYYVAYTIFIVLASLRHSSLEAFSNTMIWFVMPLTLLTLAIAVYGELKKRK